MTANQMTIDKQGKGLEAVFLYKMVSGFQKSDGLKFTN